MELPRRRRRHHGGSRQRRSSRARSDRERPPRVAGTGEGRRWPRDPGLGAARSEVGRARVGRCRRCGTNHAATQGEPRSPQRPEPRTLRGRDLNAMAHATSEHPASPTPLRLHGLSVDGVNQCVHCGLCLAYCPTFAELGTEMDSPRGRIFLIKSLAEGRIALTDSVTEHLSLCLDCRACETVCPAGVPYGRLIEAAKAEIERARPGAPGRRLFRWLNFGLLLGHPRLLGLAASGARLYQASGLQRLVRKSGLVQRLPGTLPAWEALLPPVPAKAERAAPPPLTPAEGPRRARVALLTGCVQSVIFGAHNRATARVLAKNGVDVVVPQGQGCCGALNAHGGDHARAVAMARTTIETFERARADVVVV